MSAVNSDSVRAGASGVTAGYVIEQSCLFNDDDGAKLTASSFGTPTSTKIKSCSFWFKRSLVDDSENPYLFHWDTSASGQMYFETTGKLIISDQNVDVLKTNRVFRDPTAWTHVLFLVDTSQATAADRYTLYINGVEETSFATDNRSSISQDSTTKWGGAVAAVVAGRSTSGATFDGYLAEIVLLDGTVGTVASFGETDDNGVFVPVDPSTLTFGDNGFHLDFANSSDIGNDVSGNDNDWTVANLASTDITEDSPTDDATADPVIGNYCTGSPLTDDSEITLSEGGLKTSTSTSWKSVYGTMAVTSGKWYWEGQFSATTSSNEANRYFGVVDATKNPSSGSVNTNGWVGYLQEAGSAQIIDHGSSTNITGQTAVKSDYWAVALDMDAGKIWFAKNNSWLDIGSGAGNPATAANPVFTNLLSTGSGIVTPGMSWNTDDNGGTWNFGQLGFQYTPPSGFLALCTANLPAPAIADPSAHFGEVLYTGNGSARDITWGGNSELTADYIVIKNRDQGDQFKVLDRIRGVTKEMNWDDHIAESTDANGLDDFSVTDGFGLGSGAGGYNDNTEKFVAYGWAAGGTTGSTNSDGDTDITLSVNSTAGFSYGLATSPSSGGFTVGHGLGVQPSFVIQKNTNADNGWNCWHKNLTNKTSYYVNLYNSDAEASSTVIWNNTAPTTSVMSQNANWYGASRIGLWMFFAEIEGYSSFGGYIGNGSAANGPVIYTGFSPQIVCVKGITSGGAYSWVWYDRNLASGNAANSPYLHPDNPIAQTFGIDILFLSNGVKILGTNDAANKSGYPYIYMAWAENPVGGSGVAQARAM